VRLGRLELEQPAQQGHREYLVRQVRPVRLDRRVWLARLERLGRLARWASQVASVRPAQQDPRELAAVQEQSVLLVQPVRLGLEQQAQQDRAAWLVLLERLVRQVQESQAQQAR
jgi:hypothetical protein